MGGNGSHQTNEHTTFLHVPSKDLKTKPSLDDEILSRPTSMDDEMLPSAAGADKRANAAAVADAKNALITMLKHIREQNGGKMIHLTHVLRSSSSAHVEPSPYTSNPVTIIPGPAGVVQLSNSICVEPSFSTPNPVRIIPGPAGLKVVEDVGEDADFNSGAW
ncbi:hypothetical protein Tco_0981840, partial [Tanacetum coccineum]